MNNRIINSGGAAALLAAVFLVCVAGTAIAAETPSLEELYRIIQKQQAEIDALKKQNRVVEQRLDYTADAVDRVAAAPASGHGHGGAGGKLTLGGYGEHHFNHFKDGTDKVDAHRFVLFADYAFADDLRLVSELEVEHGLVADSYECIDANTNGVFDDGECGGSAPGEVELEQAYIEWDFANNHRLKMGQFLIPVGILNETHEPDTLYGTERNNVEKNIIPTTWWETGAMVSGMVIPSLSYDVGVHSGMAADPGGTVRGGRQKSASATAEDLAYTARLKYTGVPGLEVAATVQHQEDITQGATAGEKNDATLVSTHAAYQVGDFQLRALHASWDINGLSFKTAGRDKQEGWYVEPSYRITDKLGVFYRYSEWDNAAGNSAHTDVRHQDWGLNYWLHPRVVLKADFTDSVNESKDAFNLGLGWSY